MLLGNAKKFTRTSDRGTITLHAEVPKDRLTDPAVKPFYDSYGGTVEYTLILGSDHLPRSLDINIMNKFGSDDYRSAFTATYSGWGTSGTISAPY